MTGTRHTSQDAPVSGATVAAWRRLRQSRLMLPTPAEDEQGAHASQATPDVATIGSLDTTSRGFAESQQDGLAAMIGLAKAAALPPVPARELRAPEPEPPASLLGQTGAAALPRPLLAMAMPAPAIDQPLPYVRPVPVASACLPATATQQSQERRAARNSLSSAYVPWLSLLVILTVQAVISLRLVSSNTAEQDETLYLWAGHLEWAHLVHGTPMPPFATFFSGAPVVYPPLGALADSVGGLAGARILSLCFMLGATSLLWATAGRLFGKRAAFFAAGLWAVLGPTFYLGAYATYDAMSLFLIAAAAWCVVRAGTHRDVTRWLAAASAALVLANAAKYASAIFDPVVVALAVLVACPKPGAKFATMRGAALMTYTTGALVLLITIGGGNYYTGVVQTTLTRSGVGNSVASVLSQSWSLIGVLMIVAVIGVIFCVLSRSSRQRQMTMMLLCAAGLLVPAEQARIHTLTSLNKHLDFGAWFAAIAAAYAADTVITLTRSRSVQLVTCAVCAAALIIPARLGLTQVRAIYTWPNSTQFIDTFRPIVRATSGPLLVETPYVSESVLSTGQQWERWSNTRSIVLPSGRSISVPVASEGNPNVYTRYIRAHYFALVALNFRATPALDVQLAADLAEDRDYRIVATVPYGLGRYIIWRYEPPNGAR